MHPFCHLVIRAIRYDSPTHLNGGQSFSKLLLERRLSLSLTQEALSKRLNVSLRTLKNWERGRTQPMRKVWTRVRSFLGTFICA